MSDYKVISADSHCNEPAEIYERLPVQYRARAPHEETINGERFMVFEGQAPMPVIAPNPLNEDDMQRYWRDGEDLGRQQHRAGGVDIPLRLADLEKDGVGAEVIYPQAVFKTFASPDPGVPASPVGAVQRLAPRDIRHPTGCLRGNGRDSHAQRAGCNWRGEAGGEDGLQESIAAVCNAD